MLGGCVDARWAGGPGVGRAHVVIVSYRAPALLERCLESVRTHAPEWPVHVWDNRSDLSGAVRRLSVGSPAEWHFCPENIGFAAAANSAVARLPADGLPFVLLNPDAVVLSSPTPLLAAFESEVAAVAPHVRAKGLAPWDNGHLRPTAPNLLLEHSGLASKFRGRRWSGRYPRPAEDIDWATGACLAVSRSAWREVGPFDEHYWLYCEEVDWQLRAKTKGWRIRHIPEVLFAHDAGGTVSDSLEMSRASTRLMIDSQVRLLRTHRGALSSLSFRAALPAARLLSRIQQNA